MLKPVTRKLHKATVRRADGQLTVYWYAWRGGPRLHGEPGTPEFEGAYAAAVRDRRYAPTDGKLSGLVAAYRGSPEFSGLAISTRIEWARYLDLIQDEKTKLAIGGLPVAVLSDPRVKHHLFAWRDQWRDLPRKADYALQVLSGVLSWAVQRGLIERNVLLGRKALYSSNRADQIWSEDEVARFVTAAPSPEVAQIVQLACWTGLRRADLLTLTWGDVGEIAITLVPKKSSRRRQPRRVTIPLLDPTLELLAEIQARQRHRHASLVEAANAHRRVPPPAPLTVLSNTRGQPWSVNGAEHQVVDTKKKAGIAKHLHDCRGTFATRLRLDGATNTEIADVLGWSEARVERLMALYIDNHAVIRAFAERIRAKSAARKKLT